MKDYLVILLACIIITSCVKKNSASLSDNNRATVKSQSDTASVSAFMREEIESKSNVAAIDIQLEDPNTKKAVKKSTKRIESQQNISSKLSSKTPDIKKVKQIELHKKKGFREILYRVCFVVGAVVFIGVIGRLLFP